MTSFVDPTCPIVKNMILLDSEGKRIAVKYYSQEWYAAVAQASLCTMLQFIGITIKHRLAGPQSLLSRTLRRACGTRQAGQMLVKKVLLIQ